MGCSHASRHRGTARLAVAEGGNVAAISRVHLEIGPGFSIHRRGQLFDRQRSRRSYLRDSDTRHAIDGGQWRMARVRQTDLDSLQHALALHQAGDITRAAWLYNRILKDRPRDFNALRLLGVIRLQEGNLDEAEALISKAIKYNGSSADAHYFLGRVFWQKKLTERAVFCLKQCVKIDPKYEAALVILGCIAGESGCQEEAVEFFKKALAINSRSVDTWQNCAMALVSLRRFDQALDCLDNAIEIDPGHADAVRSRAQVLHELKRYDEALASFDRAIAIKPGDPGGLVGRGMTLQNVGRHEDALICYDEALRIKPAHLDAFLNLGITLRSLQRYAESLVCLDKAIAIKPDCADAFRIRAATLQQWRRFDEAMTCLDRAIAIAPNDTEAVIGRGVVLKEQGKRDEAVAWFEQVLTTKPEFADAYYHLGLGYYEQGRLDQAIAQFERALAIRPNSAEFKLALCMGQLAVLYMDEAEIEQRRAAYQERLMGLCDEVDRNGTYCDLAQAFGSIQPFLLAYQGYNDRALQGVYGSLACRIMAESHPPVALAEPPGVVERVRVGIVSGFFCSHSNWKIPIKGWLSQLDRREFELSGYYTGSKEDGETRRAVALCDRFVQGPMSIERWRQTISADAPHVLIFPEVGMDRATAQLAAQRLAPVQCNSWGHPDTSGLPTLDYYLSSDLMEPADGEEHYTERLVRLPNLSIYYEPSDLAPISLARSDLALRATATVYWCGQSLYKYLPQFDEVFPRIARDVGDCQFVFIQYQGGTHVTEMFKKRLGRAFAAVGSRAEDYCVFLPRLDQPRFVAAVGLSDIVLDSIGWSGCNSTLESLPFDLPVVTMTGSLMRGRHSTAILEMMGVTETIARTVDEYVSTAVRLASDLPWCTAVRSRIAENKHRIYCDDACISALGEFLNRVARQRGNR